MADYCYWRVSPRIWMHRSWSDDVKLLALYILTCPHRTTEGLFRLPKEYICADLGWELERVNKAFDTLIEDGFIDYDEDAQVMLICKALKYQRPDNPNQQKAAITKLAELPETRLWPRFIALAETYAKPFAEALRRAFAGRFTQPLAEPLGKPLTEGLGERLPQPLPEPLGKPFTEGLAQPPAPSPTPAPSHALSVDPTSNGGTEENNSLTRVISPTPASPDAAPPPPKPKGSGQPSPRPAAPQSDQPAGARRKAPAKSHVLPEAWQLAGEIVEDIRRNDRGPPRPKERLKFARAIDKLMRARDSPADVEEIRAMWEWAKRDKEATKLRVWPGRLADCLVAYRAAKRREAEEYEARKWRL